MILRKYSKWEGLERVVGIAMVLLLIMPHAQVAGIYFSGRDAQLNCSFYCTCQSKDIEVVLRQHRHHHLTVMGGKYRPDLELDHKSDYMDFLGVFGAMVSKMVEIVCQLSDGQAHKVSSLLNGIENQQHTALDVKCRFQEELIWDVPAWEIDFNVFLSNGCRLTPLDYQRGVVVPMNMWIFDIHKGGTGLMNVMDVKYLMNTVAFSLSDTHSSSLPPHWMHGYLISASFVSLQYDGLLHYDCRMLFSRRVDTVNLAHNDFVRFPDCLLHASKVKIRYLSLSHNPISDLTPLYEKSPYDDGPDITIINLSYNDIRNLETFMPMPKLSVLDLSYNYIRDIDDKVFSKLLHLEQLFLDHNRIHVIGFIAFTKNIGLVKLDLSHNSLVTILPEQLPKTEKPLSVDVRNNKFPLPPFQECGNEKFPVTKVTFISANNPFICDCNAIEFERCLNRLHDNTGQNSTILANLYEDLPYLACHGPPALSGAAITGIPFTSECIIEDDCPHSCDCIVRNAEELQVNCSGRRLLEMPDTIPSFRNATVVLRLDHNPMQMLSYRAYLHYLSELYMDNCLLSSVLPAAISALQNVRILTLHNNLLQKLPASTRNITLNHVSNLTLHNNRWQCSCDSLWLPRWISKHRGVLWAPGKILCSYLRKPVEEFNDMDVNCNSPSSYLEVILAICLALASLVSTLALVFYYRTEINVLVYSKFGIRLGSTLAYGDYFSPYDAFVSYSQDNYKWVVDTLVPRLENGPGKYRLCLHYRDFPSGEPVVDNIPWAIHLSRCSILVLSNDFVKKEWCIMELRAAFQRLLLVANKLIIIVTDDVNMEDLSPDLRAYMNTHEYLKVGENHFWEKLEMFLPPKRHTDSGSVPAIAPDQAGGDQGLASDQSELELRPYTRHDRRQGPGSDVYRHDYPHLMQPGREDSRTRGVNNSGISATTHPSREEIRVRSSMRTESQTSSRIHDW